MKYTLLFFAFILAACSNSERPNKVMKMKILEFNTTIEASSETVYNVMIDKDHFPKWVSVWSPNAYFEGSWKKGRKIIYKSSDEKGNIQGMISSIKENIPGKEIYVQPIGIVEDGVEIFSKDKTKGLDKSFENYLFIDKGNGQTELKVRVAVYAELEEYFNSTWPKALEIIKTISELETSNQ